MTTSTDERSASSSARRQVVSQAGWAAAVVTAIASGCSVDTGIDQPTAGGMPTCPPGDLIDVLSEADLAGGPGISGVTAALPEEGVAGGEAIVSVTIERAAADEPVIVAAAVLQEGRVVAGSTDTVTPGGTATLSVNLVRCDTVPGPNAIALAPGRYSLAIVIDRDPPTGGRGVTEPFTVVPDAPGTTSPSS